MKLGLKNTIFSTLIISCIIGFILLLLSSFFHILNKQFQNSYYAIKGQLSSEQSHPNILLVELDQQSIDALGSFPFKRELYGEIIENFSAFKPAVIALDFLFLDPSTPEQDAIFSQAAGKHSVVLGSAIGDEGNVKMPYKGLNLRLQDVGFLPVNINQKNNTVYDFSPQYRDINSEIVHEHFSIKILRKFYGYLYGDPSYGDIGKFSQENYLFSKDISFPLARNNTQNILIHFSPRESFEKISFVQALDSRVLEKLERDISLSDRIILIGPAADGFNDEFFTPNGREYGMYIHANILSTLISKKFMMYFDASLEWVLIFLIVIISVYTNLSRNTSVLIFGNIAIILVFWLIFPLSILLWTNLILNFPSEIIFSFLLSFSAANVVKFLIEDANKKKLNNALSQYVSQNIASDILSGSGSINLDGQKKQLVCFFSDIEHFTDLSERLSPEALVGFLREYLGEMTQIIMQQEGHIDKFEGDAIMALWGAFTPHEKNDYTKACQAALTQQKSIQHYNIQCREKFGADIRVRMGIHGGEAIVGNIGAVGQKMDFTALGDNVNLASRLEGINKYYNTYICVSDVVYRACREKFVFRYIDRIRVKGKDIPVDIYELRGNIADQHENEKKFIQEFESAIQLYKNGDFSAAQKIFQQLEAIDPTSCIFSQRCKNFIQNPPHNWSGVWRFEEK